VIDVPMASVIGVVVTVIGTLIGVLIGKRKISAEARAIDSEATSKREAAVQDQYARLVKDISEESERRRADNLALRAEMAKSRTDCEKKIQELSDEVARLSAQLRETAQAARPRSSKTVREVVAGAA